MSLEHSCKPSGIRLFSRREIERCIYLEYACINTLVYCSSKESLGTEHCYKDPHNTEGQTISLPMASLRNIKVEGAPHTDNQSTEAKDHDVPCPSDIWSFNPVKHGILGAGSLVRRVLHSLG